MRKKEKRNRDKKNGYSHDEWLKRKAERNLQKHQIYLFMKEGDEYAPPNQVWEPHWIHLPGPNPLRKDVQPNAETQAA